MMPTELFCAALASCFCLAVGFAARKRDLDVPGLEVTVDGRARRDASCATSISPSTTEAAARAPRSLARLVERARPFCWVSNTLASGRERGVSSHHYRQRPFPKVNAASWPSRTSPSSPGPRRARAAGPGLRPPRLRHARLGRPLLRARAVGRRPRGQGARRQLVADNARHMLLFRERAAAHGVDPDAYVCPPEGEVIYERIDELGGARRARRLRAGLARPLRRSCSRVYRDAADGEDARRSTRSRADVQRMRAALAPLTAGDGGATGRRGPRALPRPRAGRDAALRACRLRPRCRASPTCSASCRRSPRAPGASPPLRAASRAGALLSDGLRIGYRHGFDSGPVHGPRLRQPALGRTALGRAHRPPPAAPAHVRRLPRHPRAGRARGASTRCAPSAARRPWSPTSPPARRRTCSRR